MPSYIPHAEPFSIPGNRIGCLLLHGFTGTPHEMRELGEQLAAHGWSVHAPALAGHATDIAEMLPTRWHDWYADVLAAYEHLRESCDTIFPIGLSMGGALALHLAAHRPVAGVVAISAPVDFQHPLVPWFRFTPFLLDLVPTLSKAWGKEDAHDPTLPDRHLQYHRVPTRAAASLLFDFFPHLRDDLRDVTAPALVIQARGDRLIPRNSLAVIHARLGSRDKQTLWIENSGHVAVMDSGKADVFNATIQFIRTHLSN